MNLVPIPTTTQIIKKLYIIRSVYHAEHVLTKEGKPWPLSEHTSLLNQQKQQAPIKPKPYLPTQKLLRQ